MPLSNSNRHAVAMFEAPIDTMTIHTSPDLVVIGSVMSNILPQLPPNLCGPQSIVVVSVRKEPFRIHKNHLCHHSPFFRAAFEGNFAESQSQEMTITDVSPRIFGMMVNWLYTQGITDEKGNPLSCRLSVELWILADRFMMPVLQNCAIEALNQARTQGSTVSADLVKRIYDNTTEGSPLRAYIVDVFVKDTTGGLRDNDPPQFMVDVVYEMRALARASKKRKAEETPKWQPSAKHMKMYHVDFDRAHRRGSSQNT